MSDLIRREDVIAVLCFCEETKMMLCKDLRKILEKINAIPSAEPERKTGRKFFGIVVNYPKVCTYPEYEGKPYYSIKYEENGEMIAGFGTYKPEVLSQYLREYFLPSAEPKRMKGTWVVHDYALGRERYECTECRGRCDLEYNFCPYCGTEMTR